MNKKLLKLSLLIIGILSLFLLEYLFIDKYICPTQLSEDSSTQVQTPKAMMLLIEFGKTDGLVNMVNDMKERGIYGILLINGDFIEENATVIKELLKTGIIEIATSYDPEPFWDMPYEKQYSIITDMIAKSEEYLGITPRIISSRYMASDETTVKIADELGIEYITARGTTELATVVYKPQEYDVKIISVSNIDVPEFKYGSFCDYSFYERNGTPQDMEREYQRAITEEKFIGTSHTYIGGYKERWNDMWHKFWDEYEVDWVDLDTLGIVDKSMPMWQIPINKNAPYTPEKIRPQIAYEDEPNVTNPCKVDDLNEGDGENIVIEEKNEVTIFHNGQGPMCLDLLEFLDENNIEYEEHLNTDMDFVSQLNAHKVDNPTSEGVSETYGYYPIIFIQGRAFSGFDESIEEELRKILNI